MPWKYGRSWLAFGALTLLKRISPRPCAAAVILMVALAAAFVGPSVVQGAPGDDLNAIADDFRADGNITPCLFTQAKLEYARSQIPLEYDSYAPEFGNEIDREIARWSSGGCSGGTGAPGAGAPGAVAGLQIIKAKGMGRARKEVVTLKNAGSKRVNVKGYSLRNVKGKKIRIKRRVRISVGKRLRVITGCAKGKKRPSRKGNRYYACRKKQLWKDTGDVAALLNKSGTILALRPTQ